MTSRTVWWALVSLAVAVGLTMPAHSAEPVIVLEAGGAQLRLDESTVESVRRVEDNVGRDAVAIELVPAAARALEKLTEANIDRPLHIRYEGRIVLSPIVIEPIRDGALQLIGLSPEEVVAIVVKLQ